MAGVAIEAKDLHIVTDDEARALFRNLLGSGDAWKSELMQYRTTSTWQDDWVVEVGNWLAFAQRHGFLETLLANVLPRRDADGSRDASDPIHRNVTHWLLQAMTGYYLAGTGWAFAAYEPAITDLRGDLTCADVDLQCKAPTGEVVDIQVKAPGTLGAPENVVDVHVRAAVQQAIDQLPDPPLGPALVVVNAQRGWMLSADPQVLEDLIGSTSGYEDEGVLLHEDELGRLAMATHVSAIVMLDYRRWLADQDYGCAVLLNPWATYPASSEWFPHAHVLVLRDGVFTWVRGEPQMTSFPDGTRMAPRRRD